MPPEHTPESPLKTHPIKITQKTTIRERTMKTRRKSQKETTHSTPFRSSPSVTPMKRSRGRKQSAKKKKALARDPVEWDFVIEPEYWFHSSIVMSTENGIIRKLRAKFTDRQSVLFQGTCFGRYLNMNDITIQPQLIHMMLLRELIQPNENEMWFDIGGKRVKFGIEEFCLITGLKCHGDIQESSFNYGYCRIKDVLFRGMRSVSKNDVEQNFLNAKNLSDEDMVKLGVLYLITSFFNTTKYPKAVDDSLMRMVESPDMDLLPWGKEFFKVALTSLKSVLKHRAEKLAAGEQLPSSYRLNGFLLAFQIWIYETVPSLQDSVCSNVNPSSLPRILRWSSAANVTSKVFSDNPFGDDEMDVNMILPTQLEMRQHYANGLFPKPDLAMIHYDGCVDSPRNSTLEAATEDIRESASQFDDFVECPITCTFDPHSENMLNAIDSEKRDARMLDAAKSMVNASGVDTEDNANARDAAEAEKIRSDIGLIERLEAMEFRMKKLEDRRNDRLTAIEVKQQEISTAQRKLEEEITSMKSNFEAIQEFLDNLKSLSDKVHDKRRRLI